MTFNLKKWQDMVNRKDALFVRIQTTSKERELSREFFQNCEQPVLRYDKERDRPIQKRIERDRKLTHIQITNRLARMRKNWITVCGDFDLSPHTTAKGPLIDLYASMVKLKRFEELYEEASHEKDKALAGWNTLEEFANQQLKLMEG